MRIVLTGASGLIGRRLLIDLQRKGHSVHALARRKESVSELPPERVWLWDGLKGPPPAAALDGTDAVIHLAGDPVAEGRWTAPKRERIQKSRWQGTANLIAALTELPEKRRPRVLICASAIGLYGDTGEAVADESHPAGAGFLADTVAGWEHEAIAAEGLGLRVVRLRLSVVLAPEAGALAKMAPVVLGTGRQWLSWIHIEDVVRFVDAALTDPRASGAFNLAAPHPVTNRDFTVAYAHAVGAPFTVPAPAAALRLALGEMARETVLISQRVISRRLQEDLGFEVRFSKLDQALADIYAERGLADSEFRAAQFIPAPIETVFPFFADARNLERITPPWLSFRIVSRPAEGISEGAEIVYRLKIHGVPMRWRTRILKWNPPSGFVDTQLSGPYRRWEHTHSFFPVKGGTLMTDLVVYRPPGSVLGRMTLGAWIGRDIRRIFGYRRKVLSELFASASPK